MRMASATFSTLRPPDKIIRCEVAAQRAKSQSVVWPVPPYWPARAASSRDAKSLDDRERTSYTRNNFRAFVTVKLRRVEAHECTQRVDFRGSGVHKDAN